MLCSGVNPDGLFSLLSPFTRLANNVTCNCVLVIMFILRPEVQLTLKIVRVMKFLSTFFDGLYEEHIKYLNPLIDQLPANQRSGTCVKSLRSSPPLSSL